MESVSVTGKVMTISKIHSSDVGVTKCQCEYCKEWPTHLVSIQFGEDEYKIVLCSYHKDKFRKVCG